MVATIIDWLLRSYSLRSSCEGLLTLYININYICSAGFYMHEYQTWWILLTQRMPLPTGPCCFVDLTMHHFKDDSQPWHQTPGNAKSTMPLWSFSVYRGWQTVPIGFYRWKLIFLSSHGTWKLAHDYHMCALKLPSSRGVFQKNFQKNPNFKHIFAFLGQFMAKNVARKCTKHWFSIITYLKASQKGKYFAI